MNIGVFAFPDRSEPLGFAAMVAAELASMGHAVHMPDALATALGAPQFRGNAWACDTEIILAAGGDGTFLAVQQIAAPLGIPVISVHLGRVGYLSEAQPEGWRGVLQAALDGKAGIERRAMLTASIDGEDCGLALNDVVLNRVGRRILSFGIWIGGTALDHYAADGAVIATPTGSTAYALSCGGPIVHPDVRCLILTPICPHTISARPFVLPMDAVLTLRITEPGEGASLALDGRGDRVLRSGQILSVGMAQHDARFIRINERSFYGLLREKLAFREHKS